MDLNFWSDCEREVLHPETNHRITEWPGLEGTSRIMNLQPPARQGHQSPHLLDQVAQGPIQPGLEHLQGQGIYSLSRQPIPAPHHSPGKELPPNIQPKSSLFQLKTVPPCPAVIYSFKEFTPFLFIGSKNITYHLVVSVNCVYFNW